MMIFQILTYKYLSKMKMKKNKSKEEQFDFLQKVIIIGDSGVGKSNILLRYSEGKFADNYMMTIGINYVYKIVSLDQMRVKLQIWDTAGQDKYKTITQNYYRNSDGVLIVFSIEDRQSFYSVRNWIQDISQTIKDNTQVMLVGNKIDLVQERQVLQTEAEEFAKNHQIPYLQCSAKSGDSIVKVFQQLAKMMKEKILDPQLRATEIEPQHNTVKLSSFKTQVTEKCCQS